MSYRKEELSNGEYYHIYNRGIDKRVVFEDAQDFFQFLQMLDLFNHKEALGGVEKYKYPINLKQRGKASLLVEVVAYCINGNHYHLLLRQKSDNGISRLMQKVGTGYAMYFNKKYQRSGSLFQGKFKSIHIGTDEYLKGLSAYINLNNIMHQSVKSKQRGKASLLYRSSWWEYGGVKESGAFHQICDTSAILKAFNTKQDYLRFAKEYVNNIVKMRQDKLELGDDRELFLE